MCSKAITDEETRIGSKVWRLDADVTPPDAAGGKALGLHLIARVALPQPPSWIVLPGADESDLRALMSEIGWGARTRFAVRSSARDEDDSQCSFAGIHETLPGVPIDELPEAVEHVAASPLSERVREYRARLGLPSAEGPCAVVVQEMIASESAGIAFGSGTGSGCVVIEAVERLGVAALEGQATPEKFLLRPTEAGWAIEHRRRGSQEVLVTLRNGSLLRAPLLEQRKREQVLTLDQASEIAAGMAELEWAAGHPLEVEWAWHQGTLWFLQARPQTRPIEDGIPPGQSWARANVHAQS